MFKRDEDMDETCCRNSFSDRTVEKKETPSFLLALLALLALLSIALMHSLTLLTLALSPHFHTLSLSRSHTHTAMTQRRR